MAPPADELDAVRRLQRALVVIGHPLPKSFPNLSGEPDGRFGPETRNAVIAFQTKAFPNAPKEWDGIVGKKTLAALDARLKGPDDSRFRGFTGEAIDCLEADLRRAEKYLDVVTRRLSTNAISPAAVKADTDRKVRNVFKTDGGDPFTTAFREIDVLSNFFTLRKAIGEKFPFVAEPANALGRSAFVVGTVDPTVHIQENYFALSDADRAVTLIHERAHTVLRAPGHPGTGDVLFCVVPEDGPSGITFAHAIRNPYCYELLTLALQPDYNGDRYRANPMCVNPTEEN
jgi:hypothetical protein